MNESTEEHAPYTVHQRVYKPVSETEFRVIHLLPGKFLDEIQCVLETRSFLVKTRYEAISYQWGDESKKKPIRGAYLTTQPSVPGTLAKMLPDGATRAWMKMSQYLRETAKRYPALVRLPSRFFGGMILLQILLPLPLGPPLWIPALVPRDVYIAFWTLILGTRVTDFIVKVIKTTIELSETKPWSAGNNFRLSNIGLEGHERSWSYETLQVTTNLELALRYLRRENCARTL